ncbi:MAG: formimidoylglutamase [Synergistaceae bacterium]|nr:formimidoylglutamase [Synergistaceae bacterium]
MAYILEKADRDLFYSRNDPKDRRLGELVHRGKMSSVRDSDVVIIGVPEDRGILANKGRAGAAKGPDDVRRRLYKLTPGFNMDLDRIRVIDAGNISTKGLTLEEVHLALQEAVADVVSRGGIPLVIGGGHDLTYPGLAGLVRGAGLKKDSLGLINVDSHLDVRTDENGINSGTSFYRALTQLPNKALSGSAFVEFGIQELYNSPYYYNWVKKQGGNVFTLKEVSERVMESFIQALSIVSKKGRTVALSLDIDAVRSTEAPGASASNPSGLKAPELDKIAYLAGRSPQIRYLDIMEVSPPLDQDHRTASLAASSIFWFLRGLSER